MFAGALINKAPVLAEVHCGQSNQKSLVNKPVGDVAAVEGHLEDRIYNVCCMKEPDYTMKIMGDFMWPHCL